jgi:hypothetical protein
MNAALNAPSAKIARKWLGSRKATKKASATGPAPRVAQEAGQAREQRKAADGENPLDHGL